MLARPVLHPSPDALKAFGLGKMDDVLAAPLMAHLDQCEDCRKAVASLSGDDFLKRLRQARSPNATPTPAKSLVDVAKLPGRPTSLHNLPPELAAHPQYEVLRELGSGGMGVVYLAQNKLMDRLEVLKVINKALLDRPGTVERFLREIRSAAKLSHANVVRAYNALQLGDVLAFAMEYVEGEDLAVVVKSQGPLPVAHACYYIQQAALGLQHAFEKNMVHRDIKPQNLILAREGKKHVVKILDFGLAKVTREKVEDTGLTGEGQMLGTPDYIAPEQTLDAASADIRADIYSLGCTLYYLLSGRPPFSAASLGAILLAHQMQEAKLLNLLRPEVPEELAAVVRQMMAKQPARRYQTPAEVVRALTAFIKPGAEGGTAPKSSSDLSAGEPETKAGRSVAPAAENVRRAAATTQVSPVAGWETLSGDSSASAESRKSATVRKRRPPVVRSGSRKKWLIGGGVAGLLLLGLMGMWASGVFKVKTANGIIVLENVPPDAEVLVDGTTVTLKAGDGQTVTIDIAAGEKHQLRVKKEGFKVFGQEVEIDAGRRRTIHVTLQPTAKPTAPPTAKPRIPPTAKPEAPPMANVAAEEKGFVPLFNGKDLTGWHLEGPKTTKISIADGVLTARNNGPPGFAEHLVSNRTDYTDFHLRCQIKLNGEEKPICVMARVDPSPVVFGGMRGYQIKVRREKSKSPDEPEDISLSLGLGSRVRGQYELATARKDGLPANAWHHLEVRVVGHRIHILVNGQTVLIQADEGRTFRRGAIALHFFAGTTSHYRSIEISERAATPGREPVTDPRTRWTHQAIVGNKYNERWEVFQQGEGKDWFESVTDHPKFLRWRFTEVERTPAYVELERPEGPKKIVVRLHNTYAEIGPARDKLRRWHVGKWER